MNTLLYLSFGAGRHQYEVAYALATLARYSKEQCVGPAGRILLITDTPEFFSGHPNMVEIAPTDAATVATWRGEGGHIFRTRIRVMQSILATHGGNLMAVDGDTYFLREPMALFQRLSAGHTLMYEPECAFADASIPEYGAIAKVLDEIGSFTLKDQGQAACSGRTMQWNAGVLGLSGRDAASLDDVLTVLDILHPRVPGAWSTEQTAFSIVWGATTRIHPAWRGLYHYNAHPSRIAFDQELPQRLASTAQLSESERASALYAHRPVRSRRRSMNHHAKRLIVACGLWDRVMHMKRRPTAVPAPVSAERSAES